ncbi:MULTISPECIES: hypothetical protein [Actinomadura]|uniref:Uncharacterized protein n=1 Tax=Actinomadura yumaensis TaxID=111807 RepID=A0ABW2CBB9_9ACTN|nr:hypothetical protein [Actinomadura sp. J1-007]MWK33988.1 hypothetical protein [Actinomadura sp. J1-007]
MNDDDKRARLREIETDLDALRRELPGPVDGPLDANEAAENLQEREETAGRIEDLEEERTRLRDELGVS